MQCIISVTVVHFLALILSYGLPVNLSILIQLNVGNVIMKKKIKGTEDNFSIEDYEVFQIIRC